MSLVEPVALTGQLDAEAAAAASHGEARAPTAEELFLDRLRAGEAAAFDRLVTERTPDVYALLCRLTDDPEEARDITQGFFADALRRDLFARYAPDRARFRTYVRTCVDAFVLTAALVASRP